MNTKVNRYDLYKKLFESLKKSMNQLELQKIQAETTLTWNQLKKSAKSDKDLQTLTLLRVEKEVQKAAKSKISCYSFFINAKNKATSDAKPKVPEEGANNKPSSSNVTEDKEKNIEDKENKRENELQKNKIIVSGSIKSLLKKILQKKFVIWKRN